VCFFRNSWRDLIVLVIALRACLGGRLGCSWNGLGEGSELVLEPLRLALGKRVDVFSKQLNLLAQEHYKSSLFSLILSWARALRASKTIWVFLMLISALYFLSHLCFASSTYY
jgi:hypothetical protein